MMRLTLSKNLLSNMSTTWRVSWGGCSENQKIKKSENDMGMRGLNYTDENIEWDKIRTELEEIQWKEIFNGKDT